jgi:hypothetical protein
MRALEAMKIPYYVIVERQEFDAYAAVIDPHRILILDPRYQREYESCDDLGMTKSMGPGPARNFAWDHSIQNGFAWHWVMDDNIKKFYRHNKNSHQRAADGTIFACMEDFVERYTNVAMAGPDYSFMFPQRSKYPPFIPNTRIYSCNLIRNDVPFRWRGRYNEDTILSLDMLKAGWCTIQFCAFLQEKAMTQTLKGGNTDEFYKREGTMPKSIMLTRVHPDVSRMVFKFGRWHHQVNYAIFKANKLKRRADIEFPAGVDDYGMVLIKNYQRPIT